MHTREPISRQTTDSRTLKTGLRCILKLGVIAICSVGSLWQTGVAAEPEQRTTLERIEDGFSPYVVPLPNETLVIGSGQLDAICKTPTARRTIDRWLTQRGGIVVNEGHAGLELRYFAQGIEKMTLGDRLWEGLPTPAKSLQSLVDSAISQARETRQPINRLVIIGHAGLPGCAALGGTLDDCVFEGKLSDYQRRQLIRLRPYLARESEIELRQCVTGKGPQGQRLLTAIHQLTGASATSYLADFHFGDSAAHPLVRVDGEGLKIIPPRPHR